MNRLSIQKRVEIIKLLVEGNSMRSTSRIVDVSINTVTKLLVDVGRAREKFHDEVVRNITSKRVQCDEIWAFCYAKQKNVPEGMEEYAGDFWTWVGIDADTKLVISWRIGQRDAIAANEFIKDIKSRLKNRVQLTTDGLKQYLEAIEGHFDGEIDFAQLVKIYGSESGNTKQERKYSPTTYLGRKRRLSTGGQMRSI